MPADVRELLERFDRSAFVWDNKLNELWPETRAVIETAAEAVAFRGGQYKRRELEDALAAWAAKAEEVTT